MFEVVLFGEPGRSLGKPGGCRLLGCELGPHYVNPMGFLLGGQRIRDHHFEDSGFDPGLDGLSATGRSDYFYFHRGHVNGSLGQKRLTNNCPSLPIVRV